MEKKKQRNTKIQKFLQTNIFRSWHKQWKSYRVLPGEHDYYGYLVPGSLHSSWYDCYYKLICNCSRVMCIRIWNAGHEFPIKARIKACYHHRFGSQRNYLQDRIYIYLNFYVNLDNGCKYSTMHLRCALRICDTENVNASNWKKDILFHARCAKEKYWGVITTRKILVFCLYNAFFQPFLNLNKDTQIRETNVIRN